MKLCIACSPGGHLTEALEILPSLKRHQVFFYTIDVPHTRKSLTKYRKYLIQNPVRNPLKYISVILSSLMVLLKEKPKVIISFGAGPVIPLTLVGKILFGAKLIYVECSAQVYEPSLSGKLTYPLADLFFVQWKNLVHKYGDKAIYGGLLI